MRPDRNIPQYRWPRVTEVAPARRAAPSGRIGEDRPGLRHLGRLALLAALCALPPLSIDMGLPSLPAAGVALGVSAARATLTVSLFMAGFALSPIAYGTLSDRWGRRSLLVAGLFLFTVGGVACLLAPTLGWLLLARFVQGAGAGCGPTLAFAATRDRLTGKPLGQRLAVLTMLLNTAPVVAPALGAGCLAVAGWRGVYVVLAASGVVLLVAAIAAFRETRATSASSRSGVLAELRANAALLLRRPEIVFPGLVYGLAAGAMFAYVSTSPLLLIQGLGASPALYAGLFALTGGGIVAGAFLSGRALHTTAPLKLAAAGIALMLAGSGGAILLLGWGVRTIAPIVACMVVATFGYGLIAPSTAHATLDPVPEAAGTASAVMNSVQMVCMAFSSLCASLVFSWFELLAPAIVMIGFAGLAAICLYGWANRKRISPLSVD